VLLTVLAALMFAPGRAEAHASFIGSDPADGSSLATAPPAVLLHFTEKVLLEAVGARLVDAATGSSQPLKASFGPDQNDVSVALPALSTGAYVLQFAAVDAADLHRTNGSVSFGVGVPPPPTQAARELGSSVVISSTRWLADLLVIALIGSIALLIVLAATAGRRQRLGYIRPEHLASWLKIAVASLLVIDGFVVVDQASSVGFGRVRWGSLLLSGDAGRAWVLAVPAAVAVWGLPATARRSPLGIERVVLAIGAGLLALSSGWGGHASTGGALVGWLLRSVHVGSIGLWLGLVVVTWWVTGGRWVSRMADPGGADPAIASAADRGSATVSLWRSVSTIAGIGLAGTAASGLLLAPRIAVNVTALLSSLSGRAIVVKAVVVVLLGLVGWRHRAGLHRGSAPQPRLLLVDVLGLIIALTAAVVIGGSPPARGARYSEQALRIPLSGTTQANDLTLTADLVPGFPGPNLLRVAVLDTRKPAPGPVTSVHLRLADATGRVVVETDKLPQTGTIELSGVIVPTAGNYRLMLVVARPKVPVPSASLEWNVPAKPVVRVATVVSRRPIAGPAELLAVVAGLFGGALIVIPRSRRRVRASGEGQPRIG
jgi:copper transport protein